MARYVPKELDEYFLIDVVVLFLLSNYNMPLALVYQGFIVACALGYYWAVDNGLFNPLPFVQSREKKLWGIIIGVAIGAGFIWAYTNLFNAEKPLAAIFATTAFGSSMFLGKLVYGLLIPFIETRFFFRTAMQWAGYKFRLSTSTPFSFSGLFLMIFMAAAFTIFHVTSKGINNQPELAATFSFGMLSVGLILFFQQWIEATFAHIAVNSQGVGLIDAIKESTILASQWTLLAGAGIIIYFILKKKGLFTT